MTSKKKNATQSRQAYLNSGHSCNGDHGPVSDAVIVNDAIARNRPNGLDDRVDTTLEVNGKNWPFRGTARARISMPTVGIGFVAIFAVPWATLHLSAGTISDGWRGAFVLSEIGAIFTMTLLIAYWQRHKHTPLYQRDEPSGHRQSGNRQENDKCAHRQEEG